MSRDSERDHPQGGVRLPAPAAVRWIVEQLESAGFETWAVGGAVRDELRGERSADWDFATRARPGDVRRVFRRTVPVGIEHGTVGVLARDGVMYEVTTFRRDVETDGRHAVVEFADTLDHDLARRDFTINAVAWHPLRQVLHDPFGGRDDLEAGVLRTVGEPSERFAEDWLRVLRLLRFAGRFGLTIEAKTWQAACAGAPQLIRLSPERVRDELLKVLGGPGPASHALELYRTSGALGALIPELAGLDATSWSATLAEVDAVPRHRVWLRVAALLARVGEAQRIQLPEGWVDPQLAEASPGRPRPALGEARAVAILMRLRASNAQVGVVADLVAAGLAPPVDLQGAPLRRWAAHVGPHQIPDVARLWLARARAGTGVVDDPRPAITALRRLLRQRPALQVADLAINGRDLIGLGLRPGPHFGVILEQLLDDVLEDPARNDAERLRIRALQVMAEMEDDS